MRVNGLSMMESKSSKQTSKQKTKFYKVVLFHVVISSVNIPLISSSGHLMSLIKKTISWCNPSTSGSVNRTTERQEGRMEGEQQERREDKRSPENKAAWPAPPPRCWTSYTPDLEEEPETTWTRNSHMNFQCLRHLRQRSSAAEPGYISRQETVR